MIPSLYVVFQRLRDWVKRRLFGVQPAAGPFDQPTKTAAE
jgi:hypothetical protein